MKKTEIRVGDFYVAKVGSNITTVKVLNIRERTTCNDREATVYDVINTKTGRKTTFRSAMKFRSRAVDPNTLNRIAAEGDRRATNAEPKTEATAQAVPAVESFTLDEDGNEIVAKCVHDCVIAEGVCTNCGKVLNPEEPWYAGDEQRSDPTTLSSAPALIAVPTSTTKAGAPTATTPGRLATKLAANAGPSVPHIQVRALAGTGKTTTMVEGMRLLKGQTPSITPSVQQSDIWESMQLGKHDSIRFAAFGKAIATELQDRLARYGLDQRGCEASTFHSLGYKAVIKTFGRQEPTKWAVLDIAAEVMGGDFRDLKKEPKKLTILNAVDRLVGLCKQNLSATDVDSLDTLAGHYDVDTNGSRAEIYDLVPKVLERCKNPQGKITFDDMVWLPAVHSLAVPKSDVLLVDESQDLNRMQQALAYRAGHRIVMVGDENQAIFGFAGADAESMNRMRDQLKSTLCSCIAGVVEDGRSCRSCNGRGVLGSGCITLPLTVTRRCGKAIVAEANQYVPSFEAHPSNCEGTISRARYVPRGTILTADRDYAAGVRDGDFILCRCNAPLVSQCFRFLKAGRKANIQGRDIGAGLISTITKLKAESIVDLVGKLSDWLAKEVSKENAKRNPSETRIEAIQDRHDCLICFTEGASNVDDVTRKVNTVFTDDRVSPGIKLSSIHRSKGLEAQRVFLLQPKGVGPRQDKMQAWERVQERNLLYVAITRAISELIYVSDR